MPNHSRAPRGTTLIEVMVALAIVMFGAAGVIALQRTSVALMGDARRTTRATAYAQDLATQLQLWDYTDSRLADRTDHNDEDTGDTAGAFMVTKLPVTENIADYGESDLGNANVLDPGYLIDNGLDGQPMERFWNVTDLGDANGNGKSDGKLIAVIVRWPHQSGWRRVVLMLSRKNPADF